MKLHAIERPHAMAHRHYLAHVRPRGDFEIRMRKALAFDDEAVISRGSKRIRHSAKQRIVIMKHRRRLAVHHLGRPYNLAAKHLANALMSEAYAEDWNLSRESLHQLHRHTGLIRRARPR